MALHVEKCVECGQFMNCEEIDARMAFIPDSPFGPERTEWTCGPCARRTGGQERGEGQG